MKRFLSLSATLTATLLLTACGDEQAGTKANEQDTVIQYNSSPGSVILPELAYELGYLDGLTLEDIGPSTGGPESIQLTSIGETDVGSAFNGAIIKSVAKGVPIKAVISSYGSDEKTDAGLYVLKDSGITSAKDLVGKQIGINTLGAHYEFFLADYLKNSNLTAEQIKSIEPIVVPVSSSIQTLKQEQLDAVGLGGLSAQLALQDEDIVKIASDVDVYGQTFAAGTYFFTEQYIQENPDTVRTFVTGIAKAIEWAKEQPHEVIVETFTNIIKERSAEETTDNVQYFTSFGIPATGGEVQEDEFTIWLDWLIEKGELEEGVIELDDLYTNEFNNYIQ